MYRILRDVSRGEDLEGESDLGMFCIAPLSLT